ncbi:hypothetical protein STCU_01872 [Strigomonas culicis]|nr:hypothetical protein STCU_01872 [Strigomonas culicis]|eukprot:EPY33894.1 hypothetical protein STCU_01872 [Strigomonas culicis]
MSTALRHAFLHQDCLIPQVLGALEHVELPPTPRIIFAEGFQRLLEGDAPQRELRELFEEALMLSRLVLLHTLDGNRYPPGEHAYIERVRGDPLHRLLAYELRAACEYYARLMAVTTTPHLGASVVLRTLIAADVRQDPLLGALIRQFQDHPRDADTGARLRPLPAATEEFVKECLLLERDAFGVFRFDPRADNHHLLHALQLDDITKTPESARVLRDPLLGQYGNFELVSETIHQGRWTRYTLSCRPEDHRLLPSLPELETIVAPDELDETKSLQVLVEYNKPLCDRHKQSTRESKANLAHVEVFELAAEDKRGFWEKYFLDR